MPAIPPACAQVEAGWSGTKEAAASTIAAREQNAANGGVKRFRMCFVQLTVLSMNADADPSMLGKRSPLLVANTLAINESAPWFHGLGRTVAVPAFNIPARCYFIRAITVGRMNFSGIFVISCRSVGANAAGS